MDLRHLIPKILNAFFIVFRLSDRWIYCDNFLVTFAIASVIVDDSAGLQVGIDSSWTEKFKSASF